MVIAGTCLPMAPALPTFSELALQPMCCSPSPAVHEQQFKRVSEQYTDAPHSKRCGPDRLNQPGIRL